MDRNWWSCHTQATSL